MKYNLRTLIVYLIVSSVALSSCGGFLGFDITDQGAIDSYLRSKLSEVIGEDALVLEIRLSEGGGGTFSNTIVLATVDCLDAEANKVYSKVVTLSGKLEGKDSKILGRYANDDDKLKVSASDTQKLSEVDFSKIASIVNKAGEMVEAEGNEFSGINGYTIKLNSDPEKVVHTFTIQSRQDSKTTTKSGRLATEISYLEFNFKADSQGNVSMMK